MIFHYHYCQCYPLSLLLSTPELYAKCTRIRMQAAAEKCTLKQCNLSTPAFKRLAERLGIAKFSQGRLYKAYVSMGGK